MDAETDIHLGQDIALRDAKNDLLAVMTVEEIYEWDHAEVSQNVFGTQDFRHPLVAEMNGWGRRNISGRIRVLQLPPHYDFQDLRLTPAADALASGGAWQAQRRRFSDAQPDASGARRDDQARRSRK